MREKYKGHIVANPKIDEFLEGLERDHGIKLKRLSVTSVIAVWARNRLEDFKWTLAGDIYSCDTISEGQKLLIVACQAEKSKYRQYDFIFCSYNEDGTYSWKNAFHTNDPRSSLENYAAVLYEQVSKQLDAVRLAPDIRSIIQAYLQ